MRIHLAILFFICLLSACNENRLHNSSLSKNNYLDSIELESLNTLSKYHLSNFNDSAKWVLYTIHCDDSCSIGRSHYKITLPNLPLGFFRNSLMSVDMKGDTLSLLYYFLYNDTTIIEKITSERKITDGVMFNVKNNIVIGYIKGEGVYGENGNPNSRYVNLVQPQVINFIKSNKDKLNPWFRKEAIRRKIIN